MTMTTIKTIAAVATLVVWFGLSLLLILAAAMSYNVVATINIIIVTIVLPISGVVSGIYLIERITK